MTQFGVSLSGRGADLHIGCLSKGLFRPDKVQELVTKITPKDPNSSLSFVYAPGWVD
ncbi:hypothetical protein M8C21_013755 [Ambrosia artemisiifolia]|uniref:Uncharacterized protein n=1 Tax=Ambrosia artemisiifolia TaxID=4212 RepID=A0AAD5GMR5_AMBAR|nr:hypothetical protein M8C21_013755 [Ambrosia artemisiifolia]